ncbi:MAG: beta-lactamase family protein [Clostridia bacterium]|nr:beta-lactamase family protein [Clostridia bacterium]
MNKKQLTQFLDMMRTPGSEISIRHCHKEIYHHCSGYSDDKCQKATSPDDLYILYSASKVMTCTAAMQLIERGLLSPDDPVHKYLPEYKNLTVNTNGAVTPCKNIMTVRHLFSMCGGLDYDLNAPAIRRVKAESNNLASTREVVRAIAEKPLQFEPGTHFNYSLCHDVLGAIIEVVSGMTFGDYMRANIWGPLDMKDTCFFPNIEQQERLTAQYRLENNKFVSVPKNCAYRLTDNYESGGAGMISSVEDYAIFADAMANGGTGANGAQILKPETVDLMRTPQLSPDCLSDFKRKCANKPGYSYAFGVRSLIDADAADSKSPIGEFGWDGAAASYVFIDPENKLSLFYAQQVLGHGSAYEMIHPIIRNAAYDILKEHLAD